MTSAPDLAVLVPSRGRPANVARLVEACEKTCRANTMLHFGFDDNDPQLRANLRVAHGWPYHTGPRKGLAAWTNDLADRNLGTPYLASLGDDMVPITDGWDEQLIGGIEHMGGGFAYPNDRRRSDVPEAVVISTPIVAALGWMCPPGIDHWYLDNVWRDLAVGAGCLLYCGDVIVEHRHPNVTGEPGDATYNDAAESFNSDLAAYQRWRMRNMSRDISTVRAVREAALDHQ